MESEAPRFDYDVFLSFRGSDTRQAFASVLYDLMVKAGIRVFKDDDELIAGDKIETTILEAINNSELCVPIFSENFASSKWCLEEVRRMVCLKKVICPIFYKVSVEDVKLKTPTYVDHMVKLETNKEKIEEWKDALKAATGSTGQILADQSYPDFCKDFISDVLKKLRPRDQFVVNDLIGMDNQLDRFTELLDVKSAGVRYIGISGMGGIGKTALAKFIYNKFSADFDCHSFIENIQERSSAANGLSSLEKEHQANLARISKREFDSSRGLNQRLYGKKVLVVLDDVDKSEQIEKLAGNSSSFGPGSRIVVTTRDVSVLRKCGKLKVEEIFPFEMETLEFRHALQLFSSRAFNKNFPPPDFLSLSEEVVSTAGGLPLALEVLGSHLRNQYDKGVWKDIIERSKRIPIDGGVKDRLKISYDKLDEHQKEIFLDIACFRVCTDKSKVINMWEASKFFPTYGLAVLQSMSLIKMKDNNEIWMHDLLRELGRGIVRGESRHPSKRSRLWEHDEALEVLKSKRKKENVQAISLNKYSYSKVTLTRKQLDTLEILRFLELGDVKFEGDLDNVLPNLRWLSWRPRSEFEANFSLPKLVSLELSDSYFITENWQGWSLLQGAKNLKDLYLADCAKLTRTPEFPEHMILERLVLTSCDSLAAVDSIGGLRKLQRLDLSHCSKLETLPPSIGNVTSLIELHLSWTAITELPDSIGSLENLRELRVEGCNLRNLPRRLSDLGKLEVLHAGTNPLLEELPEDIGRLVSLRILDLCGYNKVRKLPSSISQLSSLETLNLVDCDQLQELPELPTSLSELSIVSRSLKKVPDLSSMVNLVDLCIDVISDEEVETSNLNLIEKLIKLKRVKLDLKLQKSAPLPADFSRLTRLEDLSLSCQNLKDPLQLPSSLSDLFLAYVNLKEVLRIEDLHSLKEFTVYDCSFDVMDGLHLPQNLRTFDLVRCECDLMDGLHLPQNLTTLNVTKCKSLTKLPDLSGLKDLASLKLAGCKKLTEIPGLGKCKSLRKLVIYRCGSLKRLENLFELEILEELTILKCKAREDIEGIDYSKFKNCRMPQEFPWMGNSSEDEDESDEDEDEVEGGSYEDEDEWQNQTDKDEDEQPIKKKRKKDVGKDLQLVRL